jgi:hypothetical protein
MHLNYGKSKPHDGHNKILYNVKLKAMYINKGFIYCKMQSIEGIVLEVIKCLSVI